MICGYAREAHQSHKKADAGIKSCPCPYFFIMKKFVAFVMVLLFSCAGTKPLPIKPRPLIHESKLALDVFELTKEVEWFPMYERKQVRRMLVELHEYIMKQITDRIDKHPIGESVGNINF